MERIYDALLLLYIGIHTNFNHCRKPNTTNNTSIFVYRGIISTTMFTSTILIPSALAFAINNTPVSQQPQRVDGSNMPQAKITSIRSSAAVCAKYSNSMLQVFHISHKMLKNNTNLQATISQVRCSSNFDLYPKFISENEACLDITCNKTQKYMSNKLK